MQKLMSIIFSIIMFVAPSANYPKAEIDFSEHKTNYTYVFVHGLGGWGEYDPHYDLFPYWGVLGGDLMKYLNARGFNCAAASVAQNGSAWDRCCELYAQLTGTVTDYGAEHSKTHHHPRFGKSFRGRALIDKWDSVNKINLMGHSFGGATCMMLSELMAYGSEKEMKATEKDDISPLFTGGKADWIYSVTALSAPLNGTTAVYCKDVINARKNKTFRQFLVVTSIGNLAGPIYDGRTEDDCAAFDMEIDNAMDMCRGWKYCSEQYYFSLPTCMTQTDENGVTTANLNDFEYIYSAAAQEMAAYKGVTPKGTVIDEQWQPNDGLVNTISARAPFNASTADYNGGRAAKGIWNVYPVYRGDHMALMGGLLHNNPIRETYIEMMCNINKQ